MAWLLSLSVAEERRLDRYCNSECTPHTGRWLRAAHLPPASQSQSIIVFHSHDSLNFESQLQQLVVYQTSSNNGKMTHHIQYIQCWSTSEAGIRLTCVIAAIVALTLSINVVLILWHLYEYVNTRPSPSISLYTALNRLDLTGNETDYFTVQWKLHGTKLIYTLLLMDWQS